MIETVVAERFDSDAEGGATIPAKMECLDAAGNKLDVFVKFSSSQCPPGGLVRELIGCLLAQALDLNVGRAVLVDVPEMLTQSIGTIARPTADRIVGSVRPAFGSVSVGTGYILCRPPIPQNDVIRNQAVEAWAFDQLAMNPDRNHRKPNCLIKGDNLALIDHEKALSVALLGVLVPPPWDDRWVPDSAHLVHDLVRQGPLPLGRLRQAWARLDEPAIDAICDQVPHTWDQAVKQEIRTYLVDLHANLATAFDNLNKVLS